MRCPHERKEGIEPVCFSSPEETGGGDTTCRCGSHAAATCMWAAGARVRLCLLCCLCVRGAGAPPAPLRRRRQGQEWQFSVCVCVCAVSVCSPLLCAVPVCGARGCALGWERCPCPLCAPGVLPVPRGCREGHVCLLHGVVSSRCKGFVAQPRRPVPAPSPQTVKIAAPQASGQAFYPGCAGREARRGP